MKSMAQSSPAAAAAAAVSGTPSTAAAAVPQQMPGGAMQATVNPHPGTPNPSMMASEADKGKAAQNDVNAKRVETVSINVG